nr:PH domain-containing protein [Kibdelosporangium sp. MJ126-NF4]CEL15545.1 transmembrane protein, distant homology with ydbT [Kibdelosporangium sp. MJ126-NF4]CTQ98211.1 transmembrane protein, distant homology with ydbT [Kibdelosporangium sp. MJ126-NF4]
MSAVTWRRLDPRLLSIGLSVLCGPAAALVLAVSTTGVGSLQLLITLGALVVTAAVVACVMLLRLLTTRFRIVGGLFELRAGAVFRTVHRVPLGRVTSVDVTRGPLHRVVGLATLRIGTGDARSVAQTRLTLDGLRLADARALRRELLVHRGGAVGDDGVLLALDRSWIRYAPLSVWGIGAVLTAAGTTYRVLHEMKIDLGAILWSRLAEIPLWFGVTAGLVTVVVIGTVVSLCAFVENWTGYRLDRHADGALHVRRGLLTTRATTIARRQLRGVELIEPLLQRTAGAARVETVATGLGTVDEDRRKRRLTPAVPRATGLRLAEQVLGLPIDVPLAGHPRAALHRRISRGLGPVVIAAAVLVCCGLTVIGVAAALVGVPVALALAFDSYRSLGHTIRARHLYVRSGTLARRTTALHQEAIIGWSGSTSPFQRRRGLITLTAATAAGERRYRVRDVRRDTALAIIQDLSGGDTLPVASWVATGSAEKAEPAHRRR